jgi:2-methylisocitrate lyase-like PEP mutase family enzyme
LSFLAVEEINPQLPIVKGDKKKMPNQENRPSAHERRVKLRQLLDTGKMIMVPGVVDAMGAMLAEQAGFSVAYIGGGAVTNSQLGLPDVYLIDRIELIEQAKKLFNATNLPVICDADTGFTPHAANIWKTIQAYEQAGISGIHIEDALFGKHTDLPKSCSSVESMVSQIRAAVDARQDKDFVIIARTDIMLTGATVEESIRRCNAYLAAGADMAFPINIPLDVLKAKRQSIQGKIMTTGYNVPAKNEEDAGINIAIYWEFALSLQYKFLRDAMEELNRTGDVTKFKDRGYPWVVTTPEYLKFMGTEQFVEKVKKFYFDPCK